MTLTADDRKIIEKYALQNAVKHGQAPQIAAVMGRVMGECPHLRPKAKDLTPLIDEVLADVAKMKPEQWQLRLEEIAPGMLTEMCTKKEPDKGLKPLEKAESGKVVMRFAPNPNGPPTLGSSRGIVVNSEYVKKYGGKFILRFDDTDTQTKRPMPEAYGWYIEDCTWLGAKPDEVIIASDRLPVYYEHARKLIEGGHAYVCFCESEVFKTHKDAMEACPHRDTSPLENIQHWDKMLAGDYPEKSAVLRIKTDIKHKDPALRDYGAFRILRMPHPRPEVADKYIVWPLLDFEGAIEDHVQGTTHIIRGKDLMDSEKRQSFIYKYLGWKYPVTTHWGRVKMHEFGKFSTSGLRRAIEAGEFTGWDDPRLPTVRAIRRRGIRPEAVRKFMLDMGVGETDISISLETLYAENRKLVEPMANRYFFVWDPVGLEIPDAHPCVAKAPLHPAYDRGYRHIDVATKLLVCKEDAEKFTIGSKIRLKDLYNVEIRSLEPLQAAFIDDDPATAKKEKMKIIHWAPTDGIAMKVLSPDGEFTGIAEKQVVTELDKVVQLERFGFCRIDAVDDEVVAYYTHK